tara:strand:- start:202 stop:411 length:210 start_codon:yes stop_codon:yes gene_type:complete
MEIAKLSVSELRSMEPRRRSEVLKETREEIARLKLDTTLEPSKNLASLRKLKKSIARLLTVTSEKKNER